MISRPFINYSCKNPFSKQHLIHGYWGQDQDISFGGPQFNPLCHSLFFFHFNLYLLTLFSLWEKHFPWILYSDESSPLSRFSVNSLRTGTIYFIFVASVDGLGRCLISVEQMNGCMTINRTFQMFVICYSLMQFYQTTFSTQGLTLTGKDTWQVMKYKLKIILNELENTDTKGSLQGCRKNLLGATVHLYVFINQYLT